MSSVNISSLKVGSIVDGKVVKITNFGAFIDLSTGDTGLVHISEVAEEYVKDVRTYLTENQLVKVKVISIDDGGKIGLSIKKALGDSKRPADINWDSKNDLNQSFEDRLADFMKTSNDKLNDLKKNFESKRGSSWKKK